ncbi:MAG: pilin [Candidatus Kaiserbacteria bacterium]|nr:pilin [Candidatus Kaiserbacteria bacterium]
MRLCKRTLYNILLIAPICFIIFSSTIAIHAQEESDSGEKCNVQTDGLKCISFVTEVGDWFNLTGGEGRGVPSVINGIIRIAFSVSSVLLVLYIAWYGTALIYQQMTGDIFRAGKAKSNMIGAIYGISVLLCSYIILDFFVPSLLNKQAFLESEYDEVWEQAPEDFVFLNRPIYDCGGDLSDKVIHSFIASAPLTKGYGTDSRDLRYPALDKIDFSLEVKPYTEIELFDPETCSKKLEYPGDYDLDIKLLYSSSQANPSIVSIDIPYNPSRTIQEIKRTTAGQPQPNISRKVFAIVLVSIGDKQYRSRLFEEDLNPTAVWEYTVTERRSGSCPNRKGYIAFMYEFIDVMNDWSWNDCKIELTGPVEASAYEKHIQGIRN